MTKFPIHTVKSAPESVRPILEQLQGQVGFVPNLAATMADSPLVLEAFAALRGIFGRGSFSPVEREVVGMVASFENGCSYCMAAHSTFAAAQGGSDSVLKAVRAGELPADPRFAALVTFTRQLLRKQGQTSAEDIQTFMNAGFSQAQALEILIGLTQASLASMVHHMTDFALDDGFQAMKWTKSA